MAWTIALRSTRQGVLDYENIQDPLQGNGFFIPEDGIVGFSSEPSDVATTSPSIYGQIRHSIDFPPIEGELTFAIYGSQRLDWGYERLLSLFHPRYETVLEISMIFDGGVQYTRSLPVRVSSPISPPSNGGNSGGHYLVTVGLISDLGYWEGSPVTNETGTVINNGDLPVFPELLIDHNGETVVTSPSGSSMVIPSSVPAGTVVINTDPMRLELSSNSLTVPEMTGAVSMLSEPVEPISSGTTDSPYSVSGGTLISVSHIPRFLSPWTR